MLKRIVFVCLLLAAATAAGQTRYISDEIPITLRTGPSLDNRIVRNLTSGDRVQVLDVDEDAGYTRVRVQSDGSEGWLLSRYLESEPVARDRLASAERELAAARSRVEELQARVGELEDELASAREQLSTTSAAKQDLTSELEDIRDASANALSIRDQNEELRRRLAESEHRINRLTMENAELASDSRQSWFMVGAGVLFGGILIGLIAPSLRRKRRSSW